MEPPPSDPESGARPTLAARLLDPPSRAIDAMKIAGVATMACDHANKLLLQQSVPAMEGIGRLAFPLFAFVVAANYARRTRRPAAYFVRLVVWGLATQPVYVWATGRRDLNILLTLAVGVQLIEAVRRLGGARSRRERLDSGLWLALVVAASLVPDYPLLGPLLVLACHAWLERPTPDRALLALVLLAALNLDPAWALPTLAALPLALAFALRPPPMPRVPGWLFYLFYPAHLAGLRLIALYAPLTH